MEKLGVEIVIDVLKDGVITEELLQCTTSCAFASNVDDEPKNLIAWTMRNNNIKLRLNIKFKNKAYSRPFFKAFDVDLQLPFEIEINQRNINRMKKEILDYFAVS